MPSTMPWLEAAYMASQLGFGVQGLGFRVLGLRFHSLGYRVWVFQIRGSKHIASPKVLKEQPLAPSRKPLSITITLSGFMV